jgi:hypothetical protein
MADTTTTNLGLTKPEVGASADTWGGKLNTNLDLVDGIFAAAGSGTSVGLNVGTGKTLTVGGTQNMSALTASTALALDSSKNIVSVTNTGTGNNVLSASPTLTGTISAAAQTLSGNLTLSGGTANGVLYLNASKVATSGSALSFDGTNVSLGASVTSTTWGRFLGIQANYPGIVFDSTASGGEKWSIGADASVLTFRNETDTATRMVIDGSGNLGLGTSSPAAKLHVSGSAAKLYVDLGGNNYYQATDQIWQNYGGGTEYMRLTSTGLGIGTSSPARRLSVLGANAIETLASFTSQGTDANAQIDLTPTGVAWGIVNASTTALAFSVAGSTKALINSSGNLGIGTSSWPSGQRLRVAGGDVGLEGQYLYLVNANADIQMGAAQNAKITNTDSTNTLAISRTGASSIITFSTAGSERARITSGGYSKFSNNGTYAGSTASYHEFYQTDNSDTLRLTSTSSAVSGAYGLYVNLTADPNATDSFFIRCYGGANQRASIRSNGGLANYQANDANLSDERVKTDIKLVGSYWNKIKAIEIVTFKYKDQTHDDDNIGVIAQQVESVAPEFVDVDGFGETPEDGVPLKTIYTTDMYHAAIKALQEAMARIEQLEAKVAALESK